jgi:hypothetical protein
MQNKVPDRFYRYPIDDKQLHHNQNMRQDKVLNMIKENYKNNDSLINQHNC